jgi:hypothetical protein
VVNPAPPSGSAARKEAKQRQAATAKSEEGAQQGADAASVDRADSPPGAPGASGTAMTRRDRIRPGPSITTYTATGQPSAWPRDLLYGGGIGVAGLVLALGFTVLRPRARRRPPTVAAPAWVRVRSRRR